MHGAAHRALLAFHHILSTKKIRTLHAWSQELELQGLVKIGYPGVLLVADRAPCESRVAEYVRRSKRLPWQTCEVRALAAVPPGAPLDGLAHALHTLAVPASVSRRSGLVQLERLKDISAYLRAADDAAPPPDAALSFSTPMNTAQATHLFQSDASLALGEARAAKARRTAHGTAHGYPIWLGVGASPLPRSDEEPLRAPTRDLGALAERAAGADGGLHKVLHAALVGETLYTAEAGRVARRTHLESGDALATYAKHGGPVTGLAVIAVQPGRTIVCTASWDRCLRFWAAHGRAPFLCVENAAADLLKALHYDAPHAILCSGGSDKTVRLWDLAPMLAWAKGLSNDAWAAAADAPRPPLVGSYQAHTRPVVSLVSVPAAPVPSAQWADDLRDLDGALVLWSADSMGRVLQVRWDARTQQCTVERELDGPETHVHQLVPAWREDADIYTLDVWCVSSDQTARRFPLSAHAREAVLPGRVSHAGAVLGPQPPLRADVCFSVPARSVLPLGMDDLVVLGCTDGTLQLWSLAQRACVHVLDGHWHEVTFLSVWHRAPEPYLVSASLDGTVRRWPWSRVTARSEAPAAGPALTAEEEAELEALLDE
ncbi:hypothetical protein MCAP1_003578 [Malassezia caprae]|uniref:Uncharacterized protein n=1 Tax=Malassezia caprae TaxID=1381934 RepID=A0AAF0EF61_9BASI|nr:hypothetical protein MCAP1_003578 [Malassezia caprae]